MLNELDKLAIYFDVDNLKLTLVKNMRYTDLHMGNNDIEKLYKKSYNLQEILVTTKGLIECDFNDEYEKRLNEFNEYYTKKSLERETQIKQQIEYQKNKRKK